MCTTRWPGSTCTTSGSPGRDARVYVVHSTPACASADTSSRTYTFMPPLSPEPGWASGDVWSESTATRSTEYETLPNRSGFLPSGRDWADLVVGTGLRFASTAPSWARTRPCLARCRSRTHTVVGRETGTAGTHIAPV